MTREFGHGEGEQTFEPRSEEAETVEDRKKIRGAVVVDRPGRPKPEQGRETAVKFAGSTKITAYRRARGAIWRPPTAMSPSRPAFRSIARSGASRAGFYVDETMHPALSGVARRLSDNVFWRTYAEIGDQIEERAAGFLLFNDALACHRIQLSAPRPLEIATAFGHADWCCGTTAKFSTICWPKAP